jgi:hypothetical protein
VQNGKEDGGDGQNNSKMIDEDKVRQEKRVLLRVAVNYRLPKFTFNVSLKVSKKRNGHLCDARNLLI